MEWRRTDGNLKSEPPTSTERALSSKGFVKDSEIEAAAGGDGALSHTHTLVRWHPLWEMTSETISFGG